MPGLAAVKELTLIVEYMLDLSAKKTVADS